MSKITVPWLDAIVFLSADNLQLDLVGPARNRILLKDRPADQHHPEKDGILAALINRRGEGIDPDLRTAIDIKVAKALDRAMEQAGASPTWARGPGRRAGPPTRTWSYATTPSPAASL